MPSGFEAVTRLFHPVELDDGATTTWTELARANGRVAHATMQLHAIATPAGHRPLGPVDQLPVTAPEGDLGEPTRSALARVLARCTSTPERCWFGVWDGYGQLRAGSSTAMVFDERGHERHDLPGLAPADVLAARPVRAPGRDYLLLRGPLSSLDAIAEGLGRQSPNVWWPEDRAWFVISEIDFTWTYVAGPNALAEAIEASPELEALRCDLDHPATFDSDPINR